MELDEIRYGGAMVIEGYGPGFFRVNGRLVEGPALVLPGEVRPWAGLDDRDALLALGGYSDVLLLGMGDRIALPPVDLRAALEEAGLGVEVMASPPACRTYNVLLAEGRRIAAALLPVTG